MKYLLIFIVLIIGSLGCRTDAEVASYNLSQSAEQFEIKRRIVFYNGITSDYILSIQGLCSMEDRARLLAVTCKTGPREYKKHYLGLSDNVTYFSEQVVGKDVNVYHYRVIFKPQSILPDVDFKGDVTALMEK